MEAGIRYAASQLSPLESGGQSPPLLGIRPSFEFTNLSPYGIMGHENMLPLNPQRQHEFHERQSEAMQRLTEALQRVIPRHWQHAQLELDVRYSPLTNSRAIQHRLSNPVTGENTEEFSPDLFQASTALHVVFSDYEQAWKRAVIELTYLENGGYRQRKANYSYDP